MISYSKLSKLKQKFVEIFDNQAKTQDNPSFIQKLKGIEEARTRINEYTNDIKIFVDSNQDLIQSYKLMIQAIFQIYENTDNMPQVFHIQEQIQKSQDILIRMGKIKDNLIKVSSSVLEKIKEVQDTANKREEERVYYDHYRNKLNKMEKPGGEASSSEPEKHEKYIRNQSKFQTTKAKFDYLTNQLNEKVSKTEDKIEKIISDLTIKFSKEVQVSFYKQLNQIFFNMNNFESNQKEYKNELDNKYEKTQLPNEEVFQMKNSKNDKSQLEQETIQNFKNQNTEQQKQDYQYPDNNKQYNQDQEFGSSNLNYDSYQNQQNYNADNNQDQQSYNHNDQYNNGQYYDQNYNQNYDQNYNQNYDQNYDQNNDQNYDKNFDQNYGQNYDKNYGQNNDYNYGQNNDYYNDQNYDYNYGQNYDQNHDQYYDQNYNSSFDPYYNSQSNDQNKKTDIANKLTYKKDGKTYFI